MAKRKSTQNQRVGKDIMMISLSLFAIVGGVFVVRGFAQRNSVDTSVPGIYNESKLRLSKSTNATRYVMQLNSELGYCVEIIPRPSNTTATITYSDSRSQMITLGPEQSQLCFRPLSNDSNGTLELDKNVRVVQINVQSN